MKDDKPNEERRWWEPKAYRYGEGPKDRWYHTVIAIIIFLVLLWVVASLMGCSDYGVTGGTCS